MPSLFATTPKAMEPLLAAELRALGAEAVEETRAGCAFSGPLALAYRACLWSRTASRVLLPLATFDAPDEEALYQGVRGVRWSEHLGPAQTLAVDFASSRSRLAHTHFGALKTKDAIVDQLRDELGARPSIDTARPDVRVNVHLHDDRATVAIDLSGDSLHRRGWRAATAEAPLKENLAAAVLLLADWPARAAAGVPLLDPMCGSGTLAIEAGLIAADVAPGLLRRHFGLLGWRGHDAAAWRALLDEAHARAEAGRARRLPPVVGYDADPRAVRIAVDNLERAGMRGIVHVERRALADATPPAARRDTEPSGVLVVNPPYGERLGDADELGPLYEELGDTLRRRFPGWVGYVLSGNPELSKRVGLRAARRHPLWNGAIECRLLEYPIDATPVRAPAPGEAPAGPSWRREAVHVPSPASEMFANRVRKNLRHLRKWARREDVTCFRVYDADLPEYAVAVDLYEDAAHVQEYAPPATVDETRAAERLRDVMALVPALLGVDPASVFLKVRRRQRGASQYEKLGDERALREVREGGLTLLVNLGDYVDTGLFLDDRRTRALVGELAAGRDFLNLFAYTGAATVYAARGGARTTTSVDLSRTYLDWAGKNLARNGFTPDVAHELLHQDVLAWLERARRRFGLVFVAPPTFSNSKRMSADFDLQRDHGALLATAGQLLTDDGVLLFSTHFRRFRLDTDALAAAGLAAVDITPSTIPPDFARDPRVHTVLRITRQKSRTP